MLLLDPHLKGQSCTTHRHFYRSRASRGAQAISLYAQHHSAGCYLTTSTRGDCPILAQKGRDKGYLQAINVHLFEWLIVWLANFMEEGGGDFRRGAPVIFTGVR